MFKCAGTAVKNGGFLFFSTVFSPFFIGEFGAYSWQKSPAALYRLGAPLGGRRDGSLEDLMISRREGWVCVYITQFGLPLPDLKWVQWDQQQAARDPQHSHLNTAKCILSFRITKQRSAVRWTSSTICADCIYPLVSPVTLSSSRGALTTQWEHSGKKHSAPSLN